MNNTSQIPTTSLVLANPIYFFFLFFYYFLCSNYYIQYIQLYFFELIVAVLLTFQYRYHAIAKESAALQMICACVYVYMYERMNE